MSWEGKDNRSGHEAGPSLLEWGDRGLNPEPTDYESGALTD